MGKKTQTRILESSRSSAMLMFIQPEVTAFSDSATSAITRVIFSRDAIHFALVKTDC